MLRKWIHTFRYGMRGPYWVKGLPIMVAYDVTAIASGISQMQHAAGTGARTFLIGLTYDTNSKDWHLGVSRSGTDFTWVATLRRKHQADTLIQWIIYASQQNDLDDDAAYSVFLSEIATWSDA